jgi:hypothetical protein
VPTFGPALGGTVALPGGRAATLPPWAAPPADPWSAESIQPQRPAR